MTIKSQEKKLSMIKIFKYFVSDHLKACFGFKVQPGLTSFSHDENFVIVLSSECPVGCIKT